ncbi:MAG: pilus assembly protein TadG-related protein [Gemmatales bacterium]|nr:pilus assembly protein TadG-related protein [Gemmatales bacterium]
MGQCRRRQRIRRAQVAVLTAVSLVPVLGAVAFVTDGGLLLDQRRRVQATADAAALAGAYELYRHSAQSGGMDTNGAARAAALEIADRAGYSASNGCTVEVNIPPRSGIHAGRVGYVEVQIRAPQRRTFSAIFGSGDLSVAGRAVARCRWSPFRAGLIVLRPQGRGTLNAVGNARADVINAPVYVNSSDAAGGSAVGNSVVSAPQFYFGGSPGYTTTGSAAFRGVIHSSQTPVPDPLAYLPPPDPSALPVRSTRRLQLSGSGNVTLLPGVYVGGITMTGRVNVTMLPGIYYLQGGGLQVSGQGNLTGNGVLIYNDPRSSADDVNISGQGRVEISAPSSGPYQGLVIYQRRDATNTITVSGNGQTRITGTYYTANGTVRFVGNGAGDVLASQVVTSQAVITGNGRLYIDYVESQVARTRTLGLVE